MSLQSSHYLYWLVQRHHSGAGRCRLRFSFLIVAGRSGSWRDREPKVGAIPFDRGPLADLLEARSSAG